MAAATAAYYRCSVRTIGRKTGGSATAAAAYRAADRIHDERTGLTHDYQRRTGVERTELITPESGNWITARTDLWNAAEQAERKSNARVAREAIVCFPHQLSARERSRTGKEFAEWLATEYGVAVDVAWHHPDKRGDQRNHHAHILFTTREVTADGFGKKTRILDDKVTGPEQVKKMRECWADVLNRALERSDLDVRVDPRSYKDQGLDKKPGVHLGRQATTLERNGITTELGDLNRDIQADNDHVADLHRQIAALERQLAAEQQAEQRKQVQRKTAQSQEMAKQTYQHDRTRTAVERQLKGMGAERYDIGILQPSDENGDRKMLRRYWTAEELLERDPLTGDTPKLSWLKRQNWNGADIYVRPDPRGKQNDGLILVDDLSLGQLERMKQDGHKPAVITETSPQNYQAWVRVSETSLDAETASEAGRVLAERYDGDPGSIDWMHYGRLAGFTNRKGSHTRKDGKQPFVKLDSYHGKLAAEAAQVLQEARQRVQAKQPTPIQYQTTAAATAGASEAEKQQALDWFVRSRPHYQADLDGNDSRVDWHQCIALHKAGYAREAVTHALRHGRPDIEEKKKGHIEDYINRTVEKSGQWVKADRIQRREGQGSDAEIVVQRQSQQETEPTLTGDPVTDRALIEQWQHYKNRERSEERDTADQPPPARSEIPEPDSQPSDSHRPHNVRTANVLYTYDFEGRAKRDKDQELER